MSVATATYIHNPKAAYGLDLISASFGKQLSPDTKNRPPDDGMYHPSQGFSYYNQATQTEATSTPTTEKGKVDSKTGQLSQPTVLQMAQSSIQQARHSITQSASRPSEPVKLSNNEFHTSQESENLSQTTLNLSKTSDSFSSTSYQSSLPQMTSATSSGDSSHASAVNTSTVAALVIVALVTTFIACYIVFWLYLQGKKQQAMIFSSKPRSLSDCETVTSIRNLKSTENATPRSQDRKMGYWENSSETVHSSAKGSVEVSAQPAPKLLSSVFQNWIPSFVHREWKRAKNYGSKIVVFTSNMGRGTDVPTRSGTIRSHYGNNAQFTSAASSFESISPLDLQSPGWASLAASHGGGTSVPPRAVLPRKPSPPVSTKLEETCNEQQILRKPASSKCSYRSVSAGSNPRSGSGSAYLTRGQISPSVYSSLRPVAPPLLPFNLCWRDIFHVEIDHRCGGERRSGHGRFAPGPDLHGRGRDGRLVHSGGSRAVDQPPGRR